MTRNIYLGTGLDPILQVADLAELPAAVAETWANVQATDFPERAGALAAEIAEERPHVVGLQEVTLFRIQSPGDFFLGNLRPATDTALDYLALLLDSLTVRGASYTVAARTVGFDAEAPLETASGLDDLRVTDSEVILVRSDVGVGAVAGATFERNLVVALGDAWADLHPDRHGPTCCQRADLRNESSALVRRIDLIFHRGPIEPLSARRLGADPESRTASGLWPSDHAGVSARLRIR